MMERESEAVENLAAQHARAVSSSGGSHRFNAGRNPNLFSNSTLGAVNEDSQHHSESSPRLLAATGELNERQHAEQDIYALIKRRL